MPEWYLLPFYAILRAIPNKLGGVIAMIGSLLIFLILPFVHTSKLRTNRFKKINIILFFIFIFNFFLLMVLGGLPIEEPYTSISQGSTVIYFGYFAVIPFAGILESYLFSMGNVSNTEINDTNADAKQSEII